MDNDTRPVGTLDRGGAWTLLTVYVLIILIAVAFCSLLALRWDYAVNERPTMAAGWAITAALLPFLAARFAFAATLLIARMRRNESVLFVKAGRLIYLSPLIFSAGLDDIVNYTVDPSEAGFFRLDLLIHFKNGNVKRLRADPISDLDELAAVLGR